MEETKDKIRLERHRKLVEPSDEIKNAQSLSSPQNQLTILHLIQLILLLKQLPQESMGMLNTDINQRDSGVY